MQKSCRNFLAFLAAKIFILAGLVRYVTNRALRTNCILSIYFHKPEKNEFEFCLRLLKKKGFQFLSLRDIEKIIKEEMPFPKGAVLITVDDGWQSNVTNVVAVANQYEVPVTIFVATTPVEEGMYWWSYVHRAEGITPVSKNLLKKMPEENRLALLQEIKKKIIPCREAMTVEQVKQVAAFPYISIGSHTQTHPILINCNERQVYEELKVSRVKLESWTGKEVPWFAYPNGNFGHREIQILKTLNYRLAFSTQPKYLTPQLLKDNYALPRFGFLEGASLAENICRITGIWQPIMHKLPHRGWFLRQKNKKRNKRTDHDGAIQAELLSGN